MKILVRTCTALMTLTVISCGCAGENGVRNIQVTPQADKPVALDSTREELLGKYDAIVEAVKTLNATVELKPVTGSKYSGVIEEYHEVKAFLLAARPARIRVIGQVPVIGKTVFDMASDEETFRVSIPSKNKFLVGAVAAERAGAKPIENLRPQHLLEALLWPEIRKAEAVLFEEFNEDSGRYYILTVLRGGYQTEILRKIWFDRANIQVSRLQNYGPRGMLLSDIRLADWQPTDSPAGQPVAAGNVATLFPRSISVNRPHDDYRLDLQMIKVVLNEELPDSRFQLDQPAGSELVNVAEITGSKAP